MWPSIFVLVFVASCVEGMFLRKFMWRECCVRVWAITVISCRGTLPSWFQCVFVFENCWTSHSAHCSTWTKQTITAAYITCFTIIVTTKSTSAVSGNANPCSWACRSAKISASALSPIIIKKREKLSKQLRKQIAVLTNGERTQAWSPVITTIKRDVLAK